MLSNLENLALVIMPQKRCMNKKEYIIVILMIILMSACGNSNIAGYRKYEKQPSLDIFRDHVVIEEFEEFVRSVAYELSSGLHLVKVESDLDHNLEGTIHFHYMKVEGSQTILVIIEFDTVSKEVSKVTYREERTKKLCFEEMIYEIGVNQRILYGFRGFLDVKFLLIY